jgi:hypothetical protein
MDSSAQAFFEQIVETSPTGVPMDELTVTEPPQSPPESLPVNPYFKAPAPPNGAPPPEGREEERLTLDEGPVELRWPADLGPESFRELESWVNVVLGRKRRKAGIPPGS